MSKVVREDKQCQVCEHTSTQTRVLSNSAFGSPDLERRPPPPALGILFAWVEECPECGYCNHSITDPIPVDSKRLESPPYQRVLTFHQRSRLANQFLAKALLEETAGCLRTAFWSVLQAAWACDDRRQKGQARMCREQALALAAKADEQGQSLGAECEEPSWLRIELLRRSGHFEQAQVQVNTTLEEGEDPVLAFLQQRIQEEDVQPYGLDEARAGAKGKTSKPS